VREALTLDAGVELRTIGHGSPAKVLEAAIEELRPRLVVVGSTHRGRLGRVLPGSTAERVIYGCSAPVAIVPHRHEMPQGGVRAIGAGFVTTDEGRAALRSAADLARALGARLLAVMVLSPHHADDQGAELLAAPGGRPRLRLQVAAGPGGSRGVLAGRSTGRGLTPRHGFADHGRRLIAIRGSGGRDGAPRTGGRGLAAPVRHRVPAVAQRDAADG